MEGKEKEAPIFFMTKYTQTHSVMRKIAGVMASDLEI
jgi:hypothetical protein